VRHDRRILQSLELHLCVAVGDEHGACLLERGAAGDVIEVMVAVNDVPDRRGGQLSHFREIQGRCRRTDRIGDDDTRRINHEHRLIAGKFEDVDAISDRLDDCRRGRGSRRLLREANRISHSERHRQHENPHSFSTPQHQCS
jgi:hypothetical protein